MKYKVLDPHRFTDYVANARCPACGCKKVEGEKHMEHLTVNDQLTWGCYVFDYNYPDPKQHGMVFK